MSKTTIIDEQEDTKVPFLRGILTHSLQDAGLSFNDAYSLASTVRGKLTDDAKITTDELRKLVIAQLEQADKAEVILRYQTKKSSTIAVLDVDKQKSEFSLARHRRCLQSCGLAVDEAHEVTDDIYQSLTEKGLTEINSWEIGKLTYQRIKDKIGNKAARRYLVWIDFVHSGRPLLLLIGGATGCGKSTVATELAHRLEIVRTQSTDMLREVMRMMVPPRLLPVLHTSSFNAWRTMPEYIDGDEVADQDTALADGYRTQSELLSVACEAVINRALKERVSLILEGVHIHPSLVQKLPKDTDAHVAPIMLAVLKPKQLRKQIGDRGAEAPKRHAKHYLKHFDGIWRLQSFLLSEADRWSVPIIPNDDKNKVIEQIMGTIIGSLSHDFDKTPQQVFERSGSEAKDTNNKPAPADNKSGKDS